MELVSAVYKLLIVGFAYVMFDGNKVAVPKKFLHAEFLATAEDAPDPNVEKSTVIDLTKSPQESLIYFRTCTETKPTYSDEFGKVTHSYIADGLSDVSHCSAAGTCFSDAASASNEANGRLFVFPQSCPGFEVVQPHTIDIEESFVEVGKKLNSQEYLPTAPTDVSSVPLQPTVAASCAANAPNATFNGEYASK